MPCHRLLLVLICLSVTVAPPTLKMAWGADRAPVQSATPQVSIHVDAGQRGRAVSQFLTGACIEDVNHEIYGGIYSQMLFGESFQEPPTSEPVKGFAAIDGQWSVSDGALSAATGPGPKVLSTIPPFSDGQIGVDVAVPEAGDGIHNGGLIVDVNRAGPGADNFDGYEISIDAGRKVVALGRHHHDWRMLAEAKADVVPGQWVSLSVKLRGPKIDVSINGKVAIQYEDKDAALRAGSIGLRSWQCAARFRRMWVDTSAGRVELPFVSNPESDVAVSGMWRPIRTGSAMLRARLASIQPFVGAQSQFIEHAGGEGQVGIENQGLNRRGLSLRGGKVYEGYLWARAEKPTKLFVSLENRDGKKHHVETQFEVSAPEWKRYDFSLTPATDDKSAQFAIRLRSPGAVTLGHAFLQPGSWGRFKDLPLRRDVVEGMIDQGISVLRYGGSMVNSPEYRWKKMIGPRDRRTPHHGTWYPYSTNGWGIVDFLDLCEAAGFLGIPDFNIDESAQDMADFVEYINGPASSAWGARRAADGHAKPYNLKYIELGNEEPVDEVYARKFAALAQAIWAKDPKIIPVVGDFAYGHAIVDPMEFDGAASRITSLAGHRTILQLAKSSDHEVWFDVHVWTSGPGVSNDLTALPTYVDALDKVAEGAKHRVVVFEFNANNHDQRRALSNAIAIGRIERDGRIPIATSANGLQPDKQNDNGWDQGLLFLNPSQVWLQPPGYVTQMIAKSRQPLTVPATVTGSSELDVTAEKNEQGTCVVLRVTNPSDAVIVGSLTFAGFVAAERSASVVTLAAPLNAEDSAERPKAVVPVASQLAVNAHQSIIYSFPARSFTIVQFK